MKKFELVMACTNCKNKIMNELKSNGYTDFEIDMHTSILSFKNDVDPVQVKKIVNKIGYKIDEVNPIFDELEELN